MQPLLLAALLLGSSPALADAWPTQPIPDPGRLARPQAAAAKASPTLTLSYRYDSDGLVVSTQDKRFAPLPVPTGYRRSGGGLVRAWSGAPAGFLTPGIDTPATVTTLMSRGGGHGTPDTDGDGKGASCERGNASFCKPEPPSPPDTDHPHPDPDDTTDVPGPLGLGALAAAFAFSRKLRRRIQS
jgi:hypothetical protein